MSLAEAWWRTTPEFRWASLASAALIEHEFRESIKGEWLGRVVPGAKSVIGHVNATGFRIRANTWPFVVARPWLVGRLERASEGSVVTARFQMAVAERLAVLVHMLVSAMIPFWVFWVVRVDRGDAVFAIPIALLSGILPVWTAACYWATRGDEYTLRQWVGAALERAEANYRASEGAGRRTRS